MISLERKNKCIICKKEYTNNSYFSELFHLIGFWKGICNKCSKRYTSNSHSVKRLVSNWKNNTLKFYKRFKEKYIVAEKIYLDSLDFKLSKLKTLEEKIKYLKLGKKQGFIDIFCLECGKYSILFDYKKFVGKDFNTKKFKCKECANAKKRKKYNPEKQRKYRLISENTRVVNYLDNKVYKRKNLKIVQRKYRNIKLSDKDRKKLLQFGRLAIKLSKRYNLTIQIDHIIPLKGKYISGLNHPDNLQLLCKEANFKKGNSMLFKEGMSFEELKALNKMDIFGNYLI